MAVKTFAYFKRLAIIGAALLGFLVIVNWTARADASNQDAVIVAQKETKTATSDTNAPSPVSKEPESKTDEEKESAGGKKKPLEDFKPSEKIEAEQAVDFPYDI